MNMLSQEELEYLINFIENDDKRDWEKAVLDLDAGIHPDTLRKSFYVGKYSGYNVARYYQYLLENNLSSEELDRLEELKDEIYKERVKLQDITRSKRKMLRETSRIELLEEYMLSVIEEREPINFKVDSIPNTFDNEASLLVSDLHYGMKVDSVFNYFDTNVLKERMKELASKAIKYCHNNNVELLHTEILGDVVSGIIHNALIAQSEEDIIDQVLEVSEILAEFLISLRNEIPEVKVYVSYGNHGRTSPSKNDSANKTNFERLVAPYLRKTLKNTDIKIITNGDEDFITYKLKNGNLIVSTHGTRDNSTTANATFSKLLKDDVFEVHMGHFHDYKEGNGTTVNGSVIGSDDFAISIRKNSPSVQVLKVYYNDGDIGSFKLLLN